MQLRIHGREVKNFLTAPVKGIDTVEVKCSVKFC